MSARDVIAGCLKQLRRPGARTTDAGDAAFVTGALAAAGYVVERGWQPIETAPTEGKFLIASYAPTNWAYYVGTASVHPHIPRQRELSLRYARAWRQYPDPPAAEAEAKGGE